MKLIEQGSDSSEINVIKLLDCNSIEQYDKEMVFKNSNSNIKLHTYDQQKEAAHIKKYGYAKT